MANIPERDVELGTADCAFCGIKQPSGHVQIRDSKRGEVVGRICSSHTFMEIILGNEDLLVDIRRMEYL